jgi:hypothetical protein
MRIVLKRTLTDQDIGAQRCVICQGKFWLGPVTAFAISDTDILLGETCTACLEGGAERMEDELSWRARWSRITADQDERLAAEGFGSEATPTLDEYLTLEKVYRTPLYRDWVEADAAIEAGGPGLLDGDE